MKKITVVILGIAFGLLTFTTILFLSASAEAQTTYSKFQEEIIGQINGILISRFTEPIQGTVCYATSEAILNCR